MQPVAPVRPLAAWLGGKRKLAPLLIERIEAIPHQAYVEPFMGMGGVFLRRRFRPRLEVANDLNGEIVNLFRVVRRDHQQLLDAMRFWIVSRADYERLKATPPQTLSEVDRAARFLYLQRLTFGGKPGDVFGVSPTTPARFSRSLITPLVEAAHARLEAVVFECLDWAELVARYDGPQTLFYLDPPYLGGEADYGKGLFDRSQFARMAEVLGAVKGAFILSINDRPETRAAFAAFHIEPVALKYSVSAGAATEAAELIISNREVRTRLL